MLVRRYRGRPVLEPRGRLRRHVGRWRWWCFMYVSDRSVLSRSHSLLHPWGKPGDDHGSAKGAVTRTWMGGQSLSEFPMDRCLLFYYKHRGRSWWCEGREVQASGRVDRAGWGPSRAQRDIVVEIGGEGEGEYNVGMQMQDAEARTGGQGVAGAWPASKW